MASLSWGGALSCVLLFAAGAIPACGAARSGDEVLGHSVEGREIVARRFGGGNRSVVFVGGIHGGYEWNSALLAYRLIDRLEGDADLLPAGLGVVVIPVANPDGLARVCGTAGPFDAADAPAVPPADELDLSDPIVRSRFNANGVDLNRNFDCAWERRARWRTFEVDAGTKPFSEPETATLRDFFLAEEPTAVVFFHSASNGVFVEPCAGQAPAGAIELLRAYGDAAGYSVHEGFPHYDVTGNAVGWLLDRGIPAITVELATHDDVEWERNLAGVNAVLRLYAVSD